MYDGPDQLYANGDEPALGDAERLIVPPAHTGVLLDAVTEKPGLTVILLVDALAVQRCESVTVTVYTPLMLVVMADLVVSCAWLVKETGPDQT